MKKASLSFLVLIFAVLLTTLNSFAQQSEVLSERVQQTIRMNQRLRIVDLLRLPPYERGLEVRSLSVVAQSFLGKSQFKFLLQGREALRPEIATRQLREFRVTLPPSSSLDSIELIAQGEIFIESISVEVMRQRQMPTPLPGPGRPQPPRPPQFPQQPQMSQVQRVMVNRQISSRSSLELSALLPYESRMVRSITLEARSMSQAQVALVSFYGEVHGSVIVGGGFSMRPRIALMYPVSLRDLRLESIYPVQIDSLEIEFEQQISRW